MDPAPVVYKAVVAMDADRVIGHLGQLPWKLPEDLRFFKRTTLGHTVVMGRRTWYSIGRPLSERRNIVLSQTLKAAPKGTEIIRTPAELDQLGLRGTVFVIGGAEVYRTLLPRCEEILLSFVYGNHPGDTWFPPFESEFDLAETVERHPGFEVRRYRRITLRESPAEAPPR